MFYIQFTKALPKFYIVCKKIVIALYRMKKTIVAILAILYISTSVGATVHVHYCMGKLADWGLVDSNADKCSKCGMEKIEKTDNGCCRDEQKFFKNDTDQKITESAFQIIKLIPVILPVSNFEIPNVVFSTSITEKFPISHAPPGTDLAVYIRNCVFRI